jgi:phosphoglycolate phosphatase-like HAD superfamily hydrolase
MSRAFEELYGVRDAFIGVPFNGRTDAWIISQTAQNHGIDVSALAAFKPLYLEYLASELKEPGPRKGIMPGVRRLLDALSSRDDVFLALLTGNFAEGARIKLEYFDLWHYFTCGAFGDVVHERNHLLADALTQVTACSGLPAHPSRTIIIGDTPLDVGVALYGGARSIGVATGSHTVDELRTSGADVVLQDLSDLEKVLEVLERAES